MKSVRFAVSCLFAFVLFLALSSMPLAADRPEMPDGKLEIKGAEKTVLFGHAKHNKKGIACETCHHKVNGQSVFKQCSTSGCHDNLAARDGKDSLHRIMHGKNLQRDTCISCHAKVVAQKEEHKREKKQKKLLGCQASKCHQ